MYKVKILLDEAKIDEVGEYSIENIRNTIISNFTKVHLPQIKTDDNSLVFRTINDDREYGVMWSLIMDLYKRDWFRPYLLKYEWYSNRENDDGSWYKEDLIEEYKRMRYCE